MRFKDDDKLNREHYADFLIEIIKNSKEYKRDSDSLSFSLAIDSSWGTGKTTFLDMLETKIIEEEKDLKIIKYSAWKNDFWENPFETLMATILKNKMFIKTNDIKNFKKIGKDLRDAGKKIGKGFVKQRVSNFIGEDIVNEIDEKVIESGDWKRFFVSASPEYDFFKEYDEYTKSIEKLKKLLSTICKKNKLVIMVDELDRCKPLFAINMLELVKHIFDVENMIFIFALDIQQLNYSVQTVYGQGMDATGYLCRFFDYISKMPKYDINSYIDNMLLNKPLINNELFIEKTSKYGNEKIYFGNTFKFLANLYNLSLRDIDTIYASFKIFEKVELLENQNLIAYQLYLLLMIMKYKDYNCFYKLFIENSEEKINDLPFIKKLRSINRNSTINFFNNIDENIILSEIEFKSCYSQEDSNYVGFINSVENNTINAKYKKEQGWGYRIHKIEFTNKTNLSNFLFYNDLKKWENIKSLTPKEFLHRKLEMFDFSWNNQEKTSIDK